VERDALDDRPFHRVFGERGLSLLNRLDRPNLAGIDGHERRSHAVDVGDLSNMSQGYGVGRAEPAENELHVSESRGGMRRVIRRNTAIRPVVRQCSLAHQISTATWRCMNDLPQALFGD